MVDAAATAPPATAASPAAAEEEAVGRFTARRDGTLRAPEKRAALLRDVAALGFRYTRTFIYL